MTAAFSESVVEEAALGGGRPPSARCEERLGA